MNLLSKLKGELSGILNWCLKGYRLYQDEGLEPPQAVQDATGQYREDMDKVGQFINDECVLPEQRLFGGQEVYVSKDRLYQEYQKWCEGNGVFAEQKRKFGERLIEKGYKEKQKKINRENKKVWLGIGLLCDEVT